MNEFELQSTYSEALWAYIAAASEEGLTRARELGKISLEAGLDSSDIAVAHLDALRDGEPPPDIARELVSERASRFLIEALRPFSNARHRLEQMSRELAEMNDTLIARTRELELANGELETFSYSISHDLRSSLQAVLGFAQTLTVRYSQDLPPEALHHVEMIVKGARGMNELVNDLLALAQANRLPLDLESVDLGLLAREAIGELEQQLSVSGVDLTIGALPVVAADHSLLKRVFVNLISNAIKFSRGAEPRPRVEIGSSRRSKGLVLFVRDNGVGFDMGQSGRLFKAFQRLHGGADFEGTGVGLALVARIVERHGGRVWAESEPGKGATFYFTLAAEGAGNASSRNNGAPDPGCEETASGG
jgi:light-regulated signal transduction histidine kinase (bacteriophytochrome)